MFLQEKHAINWFFDDLELHFSFLRIARRPLMLNVWAHFFIVNFTIFSSSAQLFDSRETLLLQSRYNMRSLFFDLSSFSINFFHVLDVALRVSQVLGNTFGFRLQWSSKRFQNTWDSHLKNTFRAFTETLFIKMLEEREVKRNGLYARIRALRKSKLNNDTKFPHAQMRRQWFGNGFIRYFITEQCDETRRRTGAVERVMKIIFT